MSGIQISQVTVIAAVGTSKVAIDVGETRGFLRGDRKGRASRLAVSLPDTRACLLAGVDLRGRLPLHERPSGRSSDLGLDPGSVRHRHQPLAFPPVTEP